MSPPPDNAGVATPHNTAPAHTQVWPGIREWSQGRGRTASSDTAWRLFLRRPGGVAGVIGLTLLIGIAVFSGLFWPGDPLATVAEPLLWPGQNAQYPLGTDSLGRDMAAMVAHGARTSLSVGVFAAAVGLSVGILLGSLSGYFGGWIDSIITRVTELFQSTPMFLLIVVAVALFQPSPVVISLAIGLTTWEQISRLIRAEFRQQLNSDFVTAARSSGIGTVGIITREILPNVLPSIIVMASLRWLRLSSWSRVWRFWVWVTPPP